MGTSATLNFGASVTMSGADGTANITVTGDTEATAGTLTFNESGTVSGPGIINFWDVAVGTTVVWLFGYWWFSYAYVLDEKRV